MKKNSFSEELRVKRVTVGMCVIGIPGIKVTVTMFYALILGNRSRLS